MVASSEIGLGQRRLSSKQVCFSKFFKLATDCDATRELILKFRGRCFATERLALLSVRTGGQEAEFRGEVDGKVLQLFAVAHIKIEAR